VDPATAWVDPDELNFTVGEFYRLRAQADAAPVREIEGLVDDDLREIFPGSGIGKDAAALLAEHRRTIMRQVSNYTGARMFVVKSILDAIHGRTRVLGLRVAHGKDMDAVIGIVAMVGALTMTFLRQGHFTCADPPAA
jgi:hypothetical protein